MLTRHDPSLSGALYRTPLMGGVPLRGARFVRIQGTNLAIGADQDLGTVVPAGKRWYVSTAQVYNQSAGSITFFLKFKSGGTYYRLSNSATPTTGTQSVPLPLGFILEAGESLAITTTTTNGLNVAIGVVEFDATSPLKRALVLGPATGANTLYTCPTGKTAFPLSGGLPFNFSGSGQGIVAVCSDSGGTRTFKFYVVPSGQAVGANYQVGVQTSAADTRTGAGIAGALGAGDFISVDVGAAGAAQQWIAAAILEL